MNYIGKFISDFKEFYKEINSATLTGAIDVVVVRQQDGSYTSSPFHVRFGKLGVLRSREKVVDIEVNGKCVDIHMKLGESGEAFFVEEAEDDENLGILATSPLPSLMPDFEEELRKMKSELNEKDDQEYKSNLLADVVSRSIIAKDNEMITKSRSSTSEMELSRDFTKSQSSISELEFSHDFTKSVTSTEIELSQDIKLCGIDNSREFTTSGEKAVQTDPLPSDDEQPSLLSNSVPEISNGHVEFLVDECEESNLDDDDKKRGNKMFQVKKKRRRKTVASKRQRLPNKTGSFSSTASDAGSTTLHVPQISYTLPSIPNEDIFEMDVDHEIAEMDTSRPVARACSLPQMSHINNIHFGDDSLEISIEAHEHYNNEVDSMTRSRSYTSPYAAESHAFSDGDYSPILSPVSTRPSSPKSDTEYERGLTLKTDAISQTDSTEIQWVWGELPSLPSPVSTPTDNHKVSNSSNGHSGSNQMKNYHSNGDNTANADEGSSQAGSSQQHSVLGGMFRFMRKTKKLRHQPESGGIYLEDLNPDELDPKIAALYFPRRHANPILIRGSYRGVSHDDDAESGNGPSLSQSPHSVEGAPNGHVSFGIDSDNEQELHEPTYYELSRNYNDLAMSLCGGLEDDGSEIIEQKFLHSMVTYDDLCNNPSLICNPDLVLRINKKYYNWNSAAPLILSLVMYQRPLPSPTVDKLIKQHLSKKQKQKGYSSWFPWGRSVIDNNEDKKQDALSSSKDDTVSESNVNAGVHATSEIETAFEIAIDNTSTEVVEASQTTDILNDSNSTEMLITECEQTQRHERYKKSLRLSPEQIVLLDLQDGSNEVVFSVTTAYQGTTRCKCNIYLWNYDDTIVISDIDGTITKSDVLGHILPIIGKDWAQSGVAQLFTKVKRNGYQFLYLSARAIGQARITREYLKSLRQGDVSLPDGPLLLSPTSLINAFHREVIVKNPEEFKKQCLSDICHLFPSNPFYAGFGNKINDTWAYAAMGIPISRIFKINHKGEIHHELTLSFQSTYKSMSDLCDHIFPPLPESKEAHTSSCNLLGSCAPDGRLDAADFSSFVHWRDPLPAIEDCELQDDSQTSQIITK